MRATTRFQILEQFKEEKRLARFLLQLSKKELISLNALLVKVNYEYIKSYSRAHAEASSKVLVDYGLVAANPDPEDRDMKYTLTEDGARMKEMITQGAEKEPGVYRQFTRPSYSPASAPVHVHIQKPTRRTEHVSM